MDAEIQRRLEQIEAENLATQALIVSIVRAFRWNDYNIRSAKVLGCFDEAADLITGVAISEKGSAAGHVPASLKVIEQLRSCCLLSNDKPRHDEPTPASETSPASPVSH